MSEENKFNFSESNQQEIDKDKIVEEKKEAVRKDAKGLFESFKSFLNEIFDFKHDTDRDATIAAIKADIPFKGATAWILICSIFVASVGLNADSPAVVIGAMLISPLMGPILGLGLSIAINDIDTLKRSLINLAIMIVLSLLTAFLFFKFFPTADIRTTELFGRTKPDLRDVLIAFFGGLALIIARTKKGTIASVIFGVAIATALMPPLCTAGYGLAHNWDDFVGAMYLFTINTIFIALATFLVLKLLRFPMLKYANSKKRKRIAQVASVIAILVMAPAIWTFVNVLQESNFKRDANQFVENELDALPHAEYIKNNAYSEYNPDGNSEIVINTFGLDEVSESSINLLRSRMNDYGALKGSQLIFNQNRVKNLDNIRYMEELRSRDSLELMSQQEKIAFLEGKVKDLSYLERDQIPFKDLIEELKINYENLEMVAFSNEISSNMNSVDTLKVFTVKWVDSLTNNEMRQRDNKKIELFLKKRLNLDTLDLRVKQ
ncbi:DUF389 domain-containing protein [Winogradskyella ursingii]|uniref:DUF389 domain-containing protein n=1 Tax=Winogradskyella ursingii TaxID=2686079 RepID=UPI0015CCC38A|nr:DUF389 domain-containing protein [Winogradskyella ursingii]